MRIGIYNTSVGIRKSGGTETFLREMMKRLQKRHEIVLFTGEGELLDEIKEMDIKVVQLPFINKNSWLSRNLQKLNLGPLAFELESLSMYRKAKGAIEKENLDVLSTHYYLDNFWEFIQKIFHHEPIIRGMIRFLE